jgi:ADP-ribosylglycohydrolase
MFDFFSSFHIFYMPIPHNDFSDASHRIALARKSLLGVAIGDAFGESFFGDNKKMVQFIADRRIPKTKWDFTDDTIMSLAVFEQLENNAAINPDQLIQAFIRNHDKDPKRGYGATLRSILRNVAAGETWQKAASEVFDGMGSMGNGAAMRASVIGAYFFDDLQAVKHFAMQSALPTHHHPEAVAGAIAVATAAAIATQQQALSPNDFILKVANAVPDTDTKSKILKSMAIPIDFHIDTIRDILGNGRQLIAQDTVPFTIWAAAHHQHNFEAALWKAVSILGDRDTICAIVGGIVAMSAPADTIPPLWLASVEDLEKSPFRQTNQL